ncbi:MULTISPECIES: SPOR domain-containing protein [unclassified Sphingomonas]|uniref:SPOR domain-containing protein n=1 Tax=Novosphingobium rhizosphaerae TaxID=1551649 RepID=UPI0015CD7C0F
MTAHRMIRSLATTALAAGLLAGCAQGASHPGQTAARAQSALTGGEAVKAVALAEQAVLADPRNPGYRVLLGSAYMRAGRFASARQAYDDAMELGQDDGKVALSLALTDIALGHGDVALDTLNAHRQQIPVADYGLALALAGRADQAVEVLSGAVRSADASPKLRQNLAYALAMAGHWREAREMAAQDVPADQLPARMAQWAQLNDPGNTRLRVAGVLGVPGGTEDEGQPTALALANFPAPATGQPAEQAAQAATAQAGQAPVLAQFAAQELPAIDNGAAQPQVADASAAPTVEKLATIDMPPSAAAPAAIGAATPAWALAPRPGAIPASAPLAARKLARVSQADRAPALVAKAAQARAATFAPRADAVPAGTHLVQLGAFSTQEGAHRAWRHYLAVNPALKGYRPVITAATVNGKQFWRTQAAGFASATPARSLCGSVKSKGGVCIVLANPASGQPGAAPAIRFASNRR